MKIIGHRSREPAPAEVIRLRADTSVKSGDGANWGLMLVVFMRIVAGLWMLRGLLHWQTIIASDLTPFEALAPMIAGCVIFFAVADLLSAVGLWLASAWGGVLWLFSSLANILVTLAVPQFHTGGRVMLAIDFALIITYFVLTWHAARGRGD